MRERGLRSDAVGWGCLAFPGGVSGAAPRFYGGRDRLTLVRHPHRCNGPMVPGLPVTGGGCDVPCTWLVLPESRPVERPTSNVEWRSPAASIIGLRRQTLPLALRHSMFSRQGEDGSGLVGQRVPTLGIAVCGSLEASRFRSTLGDLRVFARVTSSGLQIPGTGTGYGRRLA